MCRFPREERTKTRYVCGTLSAYQCFSMLANVCVCISACVYEIMSAPVSLLVCVCSFSLNGSFFHKCVSRCVCVKFLALSTIVARSLTLFKQVSNIELVSLYMYGCYVWVFFFFTFCQTFPNFKCKIVKTKKNHKNTTAK